MSFDRFIARRYLYKAQGREEGRRFVRFITYVAIGGVAVGVGSLLLALSIVRGFSDEIEDKIFGFGAHVQIESFQDAPLSGAQVVRDSLEALSLVEYVSPAVQEFSLLRRSQTDIDGVILWGVEAAPQFLEENLISGSFDLETSEGDLAGVVIGADLARLLNVDTGDVVTAFSLPRVAELRGPIAAPRVRQFKVNGVYQTFLQNFDELYVLVDIGVARDLFGYSADEVSRLDVMLSDPREALEVVLHIEDTFGFPLMARTIFEVYRGLFAWIDLQENIIPLVISVIILVAAFNIIATLMMLILEKSREIGVLGALGASPRTIRRIFLWLDVMLSDPREALEVVLHIEDTFGFPLMARTIFEVYRGLFAWIDLQENIIPLVISVIILVAAFNIIATLMMLILEKSREIGVLGALGASPRTIRRIFLWLGAMIGLTGIGIGSALALVTALIQQRWGVIPLPAEAYYLDRAPISLSILDFLVVGGIALVLCLAAAYVPARMASQVDPVRAIRLS